jgi:hypothetical protein
VAAAPVEAPTERSAAVRAWAREVPRSAIVRGGPPRLPMPLRPLTPTDVVDGSLGFLQARPGTLALLALFLLVPAQALIVLVQGEYTAAISPLVLLGGDEPHWVGLYLGWFISSLSLLLFGGCVARLGSAWYAGGDLEAADVVRDVLPRVPAMLGAWAIGMLVKSAAIICFPLAPVAAAPFLLVGPVGAVERGGPIATVKRSFALVRRRWGAVVWALLAVGFVDQLLHAAVAALPVYALEALLPDVLDLPAVALASGVVRILTGSALAGATVLLYLDARVRAEGLDLELEAADAFGPRGGLRAPA